MKARVPAPRTARPVLAAQRARLGLSQEALADHAGLERAFVGLVERAQTNISLDNLERLAHALGVDVAELVRSP